jgi:hypothetical protein
MLGCPQGGIIRIGKPWTDIHMEPVNGSRDGNLTVREGKSQYARRSLPLTQAVREMLAGASAHLAVTLGLSHPR